MLSIRKYLCVNIDLWFELQATVRAAVIKISTTDT